METEKNTIELIKERYSELPQELQDAVTDTDLPSKMKTVANNHGLMLDQLGSLQKEILLVMLGLEPSSDFVNNISKELDVSKEKSVAITKDVNDLIFGPIRTYLRKWEEEVTQEAVENSGIVDTTPKTRPNDGISSLETAGDFSIEKEKGESPEHIESFKPMSDQSVAQYREATLNHIEDPQPVTPPASSWTKDNEKHTEPLVDHLLSKPTSIPTEKIVQKTPEVPQKPIEPPKPVRSGPDPYREPVEE